MLYYGVGHEIRTEGLIQTLLDQGKTVCLPKCLPENQMEARAITSLEDLGPRPVCHPRPQGHLPGGGAGEAGPDFSARLVFDSGGSRLGAGRGLTMIAIWKTMTG